MISLLVGVGSVSAGFAGYDTASTGAYLTQPYASTLDTSSTGAYIQQPSAYRARRYDTASTGAGAYIRPSMQGNMYPVQSRYSSMDTSSTGAFIQPSQRSWSALDTSSMGQQRAFQTSRYDTASTGAYLTQSTRGLDTASTGAYMPAMDTSSTGAFARPSWSGLDTSSMGAYTRPSMGYKHQRMESASATNPYKVNMLNLNIAPMTVQAAKIMPLKKIMGGEKHVVNNHLQLHVNHEADKTVVTKRVVHHSPVLHKTIRTHQIARNVVHDKQVHHMNVVEDRVKQVPGKQYIGTKQQVDHTTANPPAPQIAQPLMAKQMRPMKSLHMYKQF